MGISDNFDRKGWLLYIYNIRTSYDYNVAHFDHRLSLSHEAILFGNRSDHSFPESAEASVS